MTEDVTNPGLVDVVNQGDGLTKVDQAVSTGPSSNAGPLVDVADQGDGLLTVDQPVTVGPAQVSGTTVSAGGGSPQSANTITTTQNTVVGQVYGRGTPADVFV
jgi:hypothetical protein